MNLLILGGTIFLGRNLVEAALARKHTVTLFNRGKHNPDLFPDVEKIHGDRRNPDDLQALAGRSFDAVIDTCGYIPREVASSANLLAGQANMYCFISSISVYSDVSNAGVDESGPVGTLADPTVEEVTGETYGPLKVLCEQAAELAFPEKTLTIRPGLIVGPHDISDRFTYWPHRVARGGEVLAPEDPEILTQIIDVRDLSEWTIRAVERGITGVFNATGPDYPLTIGELLEACRSVSGSDATFTYVSAPFLKEMEVKPWMELPLWVPTSDGGAGFNAISVEKAIRKGLTFRPISETVHDTLFWDRGRPQENTFRNTLTPEKEAAVLAAWAKKVTEG
jgi:2'-hydroxyisoflavone reductase